MDHRLGFEPACEEHDRVTLSVEGDIPEWLSGTLLRNGPGRFRAGTRWLNHWFDGPAMLRRFSLHDGGVEYSNRFLRSEAFEHLREHGKLGFREFATDPETGLAGRLERLVSTGFTDNACVEIEARAGRVFATTESPRAVEFDPETLATLDTTGPDAPGDTRTVHPQYDPHTGETFGYGTRLGSDPGYTVYRVPDGTTEPEVIGGLSVDRAAYLHSFGLTENYVVLTEPPFVVSPLDLLRGTPVIESFEWQPERGTRFAVLDRETGDLVAAHAAPPFFVFHHVNAFETDATPDATDGDATDRDTTDREVVLDLVAYADASAIDALYLDNLRSPVPDLPTGELRRYQLPLDAPGGGRVSFETLFPGHIEFPAFDYVNRNTRPYRYVYAVSNRERPPETFQNRLVKVDVREHTVETWDEPNSYPGEPVFVPVPDGQANERVDGDDEGMVGTENDEPARAEDDGVVLSVVLDADAERSFLLVLDAASFEESARAEAPHPIPFGFHGQFYRDGEERTRSMT